MENLQVINFEKNNIPVAYESKETTDTKYVNYGYDNLYPNFLLSLYNDSPIHASIINSKATYIIGDGLKYADGKDLDVKMNAADNIKEFVDKVIKDYLIFNSFAVEVVFNVFGEAIEYHHVPMHKIRANKTKTKFWHNEDWCLSRKMITYDRVTKTNQDSKSKIFFFDGYFPSIHNVYSQPEYNGSIKSIVTDISIRSFNLNNIKNHFSVSNIITFFQGANVPDETKRKVIADLKASYTGEEGKKIIVDFQSNQGGKSAEVTSLTANDWAAAYVELRKDVQSDIFIGHGVTSPMLMGVKTEGQLGGATELETSYEIFKNTYIRVKRDELESALNQLFLFSKTITGKVTFIDKPLFNSTLSEKMKENVMTINEIRKDAGLPALPDGDRLISKTPTTSPDQVNPAQVAPVQQEDVKKNSDPESKKLTEADYELIKDLGASFDEFDILGKYDTAHFEFSVSDDVAQYVLGNDIKHLTIGELNALIKKDTGVKVSSNRLREILDQLHQSGIIKVTYDDGGKVHIDPPNKATVPNTDAVSVMYQYEKRPEMSGGDLLPTSRSFCVKLIENKRLYTRAEIQQMSGIFGYDVYRFCGGFYFNPETQETTPQCRHRWVAYSVKKRAN
jgi:hypothetical protein